MFKLRNFLVFLSLFTYPVYADEITIPGDVFNSIPELKDSLNDLARGNEGKGWVESATISWDSNSITIRINAKIRHKHKTNGVTIYSTSETLNGRIVARDCQVVEVDARATGFLSDALLRNRSFLRRALDGIVNVPELALQIPADIREQCRPQVTESIEAFGAVIRPGTILTLGDTMTSDDRRFTLVFQPGDSNFVLYQGSSPLWSSATDGTDGAQVVFQDDGNLVMYSASGTPLWASGTDGAGRDTFLALQSDGNLVLYTNSGRPLWSTNTCCR